MSLSFLPDRHFTWPISFQLNSVSEIISFLKGKETSVTMQLEQAENNILIKQSNYIHAVCYDNLS